MTERQFYRMLYGRIGHLTPICADCGRLCGKACCKGDRDGDGMYLFPGEEKMYGDVSAWAKVSVTDFEYEQGRFAPLLACDGRCERKIRPLACRIFPLTPYVGRDGRLSVIVDPRGRGLCPMAVLRISDFDAEFVNAVGDVGRIMMKNPHCRAFLKSLSATFDDIMRL